MCGILAVLGCSDPTRAKRVRVLELSRRQLFSSYLVFLISCFTHDTFVGFNLYAPVDIKIFYTVNQL